MFDSSGGDVKVLEKAQKLQWPHWYGNGFRWSCVPCNHRSLAYDTEAQARAAGDTHVKVKHPGGKPDWKN